MSIHIEWHCHILLISRIVRAQVWIERVEDTKRQQVRRSRILPASILENHNKCNKRTVLATEHPIASMEISQKTELLSKQASSLNMRKSHFPLDVYSNSENECHPAGSAFLWPPLRAVSLT